MQRCSEAGVAIAKGEKEKKTLRLLVLQGEPLHPEAVQVAGNPSRLDGASEVACAALLAHCNAAQSAYSPIDGRSCFGPECPGPPSSLQRTHTNPSQNCKERSVYAFWQQKKCLTRLQGRKSLSLLAPTKMPHKIARKEVLKPSGIDRTPSQSCREEQAYAFCIDNAGSVTRGRKAARLVMSTPKGACRPHKGLSNGSACLSSQEQQLLPAPRLCAVDWTAST